LNLNAYSSPEKYIVLGEITGHYGIKGWVKVKSYTRPFQQIFEYPDWYLSLDKTNRKRKGWGLNSRLGPFNLKSGKKIGKNLVAWLSGVDSREAAESLIGKSIEIPEAWLPTPDNGEYYWSQLIGLKVTNVAGVDLGQVDHLLETGANDVLVVSDFDQNDNSIERLLPWSEQVVLDVDLEQGTIMVDWDADF
jgi:16S rRNA processing protein RimM